MMIFIQQILTTYSGSDTILPSFTCSLIPTPFHWSFSLFTNEEHHKNENACHYLEQGLANCGSCATCGSEN